MDQIIIFPENERQINLLKSLLEEMKMRFEINTSKDESQLSEDAFYSKIDKSLQQAASGKTKLVSKDSQKAILGL